LKAKTSAYIVAQAIAVAVVLALISLPLESPTLPTESTNDLSAIFLSGVSPDGLQLEMALNSTTMRANGSIGGQVSVINTLGGGVTVGLPEPSQNMSSWINSINICPSSDFLGYAVFDGHVALDNVSLAGPPLVLVPPMMIICTIPYYVPGPVTFLSRGDSSGQTVVYAQSPSSTVDDQLSITTRFCNTTFSGTESGAQVFSCSWTSPGLVGYWDGDPSSAGGNFGFTSPGFARLPPGVYTVMAWDVWNQYAFARVLVTSAAG